MLNKVILIGRLVRDVEVKNVGEVPVASFSLAVDRRFRSKNSEQPTADFIPVSCWRKTAEFVEKYFQKGKQVYVSGSLETYSYEQNREKRYGFRVNAEEVGFADSAKTGDKPAIDATQTKDDIVYGNDFTPMDSNSGPFDDLPF